MRATSVPCPACHGLVHSKLLSWVRELPLSAYIVLVHPRFQLDDTDRDWYDMKLYCGRAGQSAAWAGKSSLDFARDGSSSATKLAAAACPDGEAVTELLVEHERRRWGDRDLYHFGIRCAPMRGDGDSAASTQQLQLHGRRARKARTGVGCGGGQLARGLRVHRAFQRDGDIDQYDFSLACAAAGGANASSTADVGSSERLGGAVARAAAKAEAASQSTVDEGTLDAAELKAAELEAATKAAEAATAAREAAAGQEMREAEAAARAEAMARHAAEAAEAAKAVEEAAVATAAAAAAAKGVNREEEAGKKVASAAEAATPGAEGSRAGGDEGSTATRPEVAAAGAKAADADADVEEAVAATVDSLLASVEDAAGAGGEEQEGKTSRRAQDKGDSQDDEDEDEEKDEL